MTSEQKKKCRVIIHGASTAAGGIGAGLAQIPASDNALIVPIQISMVVSLGKVFGLSLSESGAEAMLTTVATTMVGRGASQLLVGWIPIAGNILNAATAASVTEAAGWAVAKLMDEQ